MTPEELVASLQALDYPKRTTLVEEADMVMKGGITSGVVYPLAVCEIARTKRFKNLGGSSAGGIAAGIAAAAELGRDAGGFQELAKLPDDLGRDLLRMFQPSRTTRPLFRILLAAMDKERGKGVRAARLLGGVVGAAPAPFAGTLLGGAALGLWGLLAVAGAPHHADDWRRLVMGLAFVALPALGLGLVAALAGTALSGKRRLESNGYGMCRGSAGPTWSKAEPKPGRVEPFADWLHVKLNAAAKVDDVRGHVLTFGHLWGAPEGTAVRPDNYDVRLEMMTTNVTFCRPVRLPFEQNLYSYCPLELAEYFPPPVMEHLRNHARPKSRADSPDWKCPDHPDQVLLRLPVAGDLPVIVAVRLTLSFPVLISAVPLFAVDHGPETPGPVRCWFSDGGISSNFPIHFFDSLWPKRPTFGISLGPYPVGRPKADVYFRGASTQAVPRSRPTDSFPAFVAAVADSLQNWSDEGQAMLPGYRDRIVEVHHSEEEGGLNLNMSRKTILSMCTRGHAAAVSLRQFDFTKHRDVRYRTAMAQLDRATRDMLSKYDVALPGGLDGYRTFVSTSPFSEATRQWRQDAVKRTDLLLAFVGRTIGQQPAAATAATAVPVVPAPDFMHPKTEPHPVPDLRIVAHF
ncbi:MAG: hypothetical protein QOK43_281 [Acidimicrobiaceae bacterium]|nr:hypothetical protein [Acidimicrobiaceae bacterium]